MADNPFEYFLGHMNHDAVTLLERNHDVARVVRGLIDELVTFTRQKGVPFERVRLVDAHVVPTDEGYARMQARFVVQ